MRDGNIISKLERLGLSPAEAQVYAALVRSGGTLGASAVAAATGLPRTNVYPILHSLLDRGIVEAEAGYGSRFTALRPKEALPSLMQRARDDLAEREQLAQLLTDQLEALAEPEEKNGDAEVIQVIRDPRVATSRYERLQMEAKQRSDAFVKYPIFDVHRGNPAQAEAIRRGVHYRTVYERAILEAPEVKPYLAEWIAEGEEARVYDGELPHKLVVVDQQNILLPLITPGREARTLYIRHPQLGASLTLLFESFWERSTPIPQIAGAKPAKGTPAGNSRKANSQKGAPVFRGTERVNHAAAKRR